MEVSDVPFTPLTLEPLTPLTEPPPLKNLLLFEATEPPPPPLVIGWPDLSTPAPLAFRGGRWSLLPLMLGRAYPLASEPGVLAVEEPPLVTCTLPLAPLATPLMLASNDRVRERGMVR